VIYMHAMIIPHLKRVTTVTLKQYY
jgi:hypothetical protein